MAVGLNDYVIWVEPSMVNLNAMDLVNKMNEMDYDLKQIKEMDSGLKEIKMKCDQWSW